MTAVRDILGLADTDVTLGDGDLVTDAVIVSAVSNVDGDITLSIATMEGTSWITALGLLTAALDIEMADLGRADD